MKSEYTITNIDINNQNDVVETIQLIYRVFLEKNWETSSEKLKLHYQKYYGEHMTNTTTLQRFKQSSIFLVAKHNNTIIGMIRGRKDKIVNIYVDSNYQGHGIGKQLLQKYEEEAKAQGSKSIILKPSQYAYNFYLKNGFIPQENTIYLEKII